MFIQATSHVLVDEQRIIGIKGISNGPSSEMQALVEGQERAPALNVENFENTG